MEELIKMKVRAEKRWTVAVHNVDFFLLQTENFHEINPTKKEVKSNSLVKFEATKLAQFSRLQCNTDLNLPPSNWLSDTFGLKHAVHPASGFTRWERSMNCSVFVSFNFFFWF